MVCFSQTACGLFALVLARSVGRLGGVLANSRTGLYVVVLIDLFPHAMVDEPGVTMLGQFYLGPAGEVAATRLFSSPETQLIGKKI